LGGRRRLGGRLRPACGPLGGALRRRDRGPAADPAEEATDDTAEEADETTGGTGTGFCAADAGRAKITVRIKPSMKVTARPPQTYKHARSVQAPTLISPTLERMGTFPSTARKPRKTLRYLATAPSSVTRR
jgi:hypothetical protein